MLKQTVKVRKVHPACFYQITTRMEVTIAHAYQTSLRFHVKEANTNTSASITPHIGCYNYRDYSKKYNIYRISGQCYFRLFCKQNLIARFTHIYSISKTSALSNDSRIEISWMLINDQHVTQRQKQAAVTKVFCHIHADVVKSLRQLVYFGFLPERILGNVNCCQLARWDRYNY